MSRATDPRDFVSVDVSEITDDIAAMYTAITGRTATSGPDRLFIQWVASVILLGNSNINYAANQNVPSTAEGENLDLLGEMLYERARPSETYAHVQMEFTISEEQETALLIPAGTRVTNNVGSITFVTDEDALVEIGETTVEVGATCETPGTAGNGIAAGELCVCVDEFPYYDSCENIDASDGGSDVPDDDEYYDLLVASQDAFSTAGPEGAYRYLAMAVSTEIEDVVVNSPSPCEVRIYGLMSDGSIPGAEMKAAILEACSQDGVRPLTDSVIVGDPATVSYNITLTYYLPKDSPNTTADLVAAIEAAVDEYKSWQAGKLGRDINPSKLQQLIMEAGAKRVVLTSPSYTVLRDGTISDPDTPLADTIPQIAVVGTVSLTNGGYEDE